MSDTKINMFEFERAAEILSPASATQTRTNPLQEQCAEIHNLPAADFVLTHDILRNNVCRICATYHETGPKLVPLYPNHDGLKLSNLVNILLPIKVQEKDGLPEYACKPCANQLLAWNEMRASCIHADKILVSQAQLLVESNHYASRVERSQLKETVESVLATYLLNVESMELVCQECNLRTSTDEFIHHLESKHRDVRDREHLEEFVREHVTFEETLLLEPEDVMSIGSPASNEVSDAPQSTHCTHCTKTFSARTELAHHLRTHSEVELSCINCCGVTGDREEFIKASEDHTHDSLRGRSPDRAYRRPPEATTIQKEETNQKRIPAVCPECNRTFSNKYNMLNHMKRHSNTESEQFPCECGRSYSTRGNLAAHRRAAHAPRPAARPPAARVFLCQLCARAFLSRSGRDRHLHTHAPRAFRCQLCGRAFRRRAHLRYHVGTHRRRPAPPR